MALLVAMAPSSGLAQRARPGILGRQAPPWQVDRWYNLPQGVDRVSLGDYKGKVVYLFCFQAWCPGCHRYGFPAIRKMIEHYKGRPEVAFVAVQTVFEGYDANTPDKALTTARRYGLTIPIGHSGGRGERSALMRDYRTGGTPWVVIIDKTGRVRFNDFHIPPEQSVRLIDTLLKEDPADPLPTVPPSRGGRDLIGQPWPTLAFDQWIGTPHNTAVGGKGKVTLYRWWTDTCPYCRASLPAIERIRKQYAERGLEVVAVYHPKPIRAISGEVIAAAADRFGYHGPIAVDRDWSALRKAYLDAKPRRATSVSILVDAKGIVRFVHPGPVLFPSVDPAYRRENEDFEALNRAIEALLSQQDD